MILDKPWGTVVSYALNQPVSVRVITVQPGKETSVHSHRMRDETWVVLDGGLTVEIGDDVVEAGPGDLVYKPRGQWHTFWNAGDEPARILEIISPAGFERFFAELAPLSAGGAPDPDAFAELCERYALDMQPDTVPELCERFGLWFPGVE